MDNAIGSPVSSIDSAVDQSPDNGDGQLAGGFAGDPVSAMGAVETHHYDDAIIVSNWDDYSFLPTEEEFTRVYTAVVVASSGLHHYHGDELPAPPDEYYSFLPTEEEFTRAYTGVASSGIHHYHGDEFPAPADSGGDEAHGQMYIGYDDDDDVGSDELQSDSGSDEAYSQIYTDYYDDEDVSGAAVGLRYGDELSIDSDNEAEDQAEAEQQRGHGRHDDERSFLEPLEIATAVFMQGRDNGGRLHPMLELLTGGERRIFQMIIAAVAFYQRPVGGGGWSGGSVAALEKRKHAGGESGKETAEDDDATCVICMEDYKMGDDICVMPCSSKHCFHEACLAKWLERSRMCPLCRHELPTDDDDDEKEEDDDDWDLYWGDD